MDVNVFNIAPAGKSGCLHMSKKQGGFYWDESLAKVVREGCKMKIQISSTVSNFRARGSSDGYVDRWDDVMYHLKFLQLRRGSICLERMDAPDIGPFSISVAGENGYYLVTLLEASEDETEVREYTNLKVESEMIEILGNFWHSSFLISDYDLVCSMVEEFFKTGDVSRQWLN